MTGAMPGAVRQPLRRVRAMSGSTRRILTAKLLALSLIGLALVVVAVVHRRSTAPVPPPGAVAR